MEHNIMAAGANRNRNTATHTSLTSLQNAFIFSNQRDQINLTNAATVFTMLDTFLPNTVVIAARQSRASDKMDTASSFQRNTTANNVTTLDLTADRL